MMRAFFLSLFLVPMIVFAGVDAKNNLRTDTLTLGTNATVSNFPVATETDPRLAAQDSQAKDPTGWNEQDQGTWSFDAATRTLAVTNPGALWVNGTSNSIQVATTAIGTNRGLWYVYYPNGSASITTSQALWSLSDAQLATVYADPDRGKYIVADEMHTAWMPWRTHRRFHVVPGSAASYSSGLTLTASNATAFSVSAGAIVDEDLYHSLGATGQCWVITRDGATGYGAVYGPQSTLFVTNGTGACYDNGGTLANPGANEYWSIWLYAIDIHGGPSVVAIVGQSVGTLSTIQAEQPPANLDGVVPGAEAVLLWQVIFKGPGATWTQNRDFRLSRVTSSAALSEVDPVYASERSRYLTNAIQGAVVQDGTSNSVTTNAGVLTLTVRTNFTAGASGGGDVYTTSNNQFTVAQSIRNQTTPGTTPGAPTLIEAGGPNTTGLVVRGASYSAPATFLPTDISALGAWYDSASNVNLSGTNVVSWGDVSGKSSANLGMSTTASRPQYIAIGSNGFPALIFNGVHAGGFYLTNNLSFTASNSAFFTVYKRDSAAPTAYYTMWSLQGRIGLAAGNANGSYNGDVTAFPAGGGKSDGVCIRSFVVKDMVMSFSENGSNLVSSLTNPATADFPAGSTKFAVGGRATDGAYAFGGQMYAVLVFTNTVSTADVAKVEGYLAWKYGLQSNLPSTHLYKSEAPGIITTTPTAPLIEAQGASSNLLFRVDASGSITGTSASVQSLQVTGGAAVGALLVCTNANGTTAWKSSDSFFATLTAAIAITGANQVIKFQSVPLGSNGYAAGIFTITNAGIYMGSGQVWYYPVSAVKDSRVCVGPYTFECNGFLDAAGQSKTPIPFGPVYLTNGARCWIQGGAAGETNQIYGSGVSYTYLGIQRIP